MLFGSGMGYRIYFQPSGRGFHHGEHVATLALAGGPI